jgi:hypothetical protein
MQPLTLRVAYLASFSLSTALLASCAHFQSTGVPRLASRYYGTWIHVGPQYRDWWELSATNAAGRHYPDCTWSSAAAVIGPDRFRTMDGSVMNLHLAEGHLLLFVSDDMSKVAVWRPVETNAVCSKSDGIRVPAKFPAIRTPAIAPRYHGVWANVLPHLGSWWEIDTKGVTAYGYNAQGSCISLHIAALGPDQVELQFQGSQVASLHLAEGNLLLGQTDDSSGYALYRKADGTAICRNPDDGTYAKNAPHPAPLH